MKTLSTSVLLRKIFLIMIFSCSVTVSGAQIFSAAQLYEKGYTAFQSKDYKHATLYLFAYIQKQPAAMQNQSFAQKVKEVYEYSEERVATGTEPRGDQACACVRPTEHNKPAMERPDAVDNEDEVQVPIFPGGVSNDLVASREPSGMTVSTGNLYFTANDEAGAAVWRTSQHSRPGDERVLYWEAGAKFGDIVYAKIGAFYYGYFFAERGNVITIKKVSLSGGNALTIATVTDIDIQNSRHNLITDGTDLYWQDASSIKKISINGGAVSTIEGSTFDSPTTPTPGIALQDDKIIYTRMDKIYFIQKGGSTQDHSARLVYDGNNPLNRITTLNVANNTIYWGEDNGKVRKKVGASITVVLGSGTGVPTSVNAEGTKIAWTYCSGGACTLKRSNLTTLAIKPNAHAVFVTPANRLFWGDRAGVHKRAF